MTVRFSVLPVALLVTAAGLAQAAEAASSGPAATDALGVLADLMLIDGACRNDTVNFGIGFRFAAENGVAETAVLPGGPRRAEFEAVLRARKASFGHDELCGEIAANYAAALPGSVLMSPAAR